MATNDSINSDGLPLTTTGEPTDQLGPKGDNNFENENEPDDDDDIDVNTIHSDFDDEPLDDDEDLDEDEVKRLFPGEDSYSENGDEDDIEAEETYEGLNDDEDESEGLVNDNMAEMPVIPSPS